VQPELPPLVRNALARLIRAFAPERVVLFGSHAKGMAHAHSDIDLLVITNLHGRADYHERRARQLVAGCFPRVDVVLATPDEVAGANTARSPFLLGILGSGVTLYARSTSLDAPSADLIPRLHALVTQTRKTGISAPDS
jgi:uncharacterized protein